MNADDVDWNEEIDRQEFLERLQTYKRIHWVASAVALLSFVGFIMYLIVIQPSDPILGQGILFFVFGSCFLTLAIMSSFASWTMNAEEFDEFVQFLSWRNKPQPKMLSKSYWLWQTRLLTPFGVLMGLVPTLFGLWEIVSFVMSTI